MRYLCLERLPPTRNRDILVDVTLINERDAVPPGFTVLEYTHDSREKATKKKVLCVRWMVPSMTHDAITDLILLYRSQRRAPIGYTLVGELNNMSLCYRMGKVKSTSSTPEAAPSRELEGYAASAAPYGMPPVASGLPYSFTPQTTSPPTPAPRNPPTHSAAVPTATSSNSNIPPLSGIEWKMNPRYSVLIELQSLTIPDINGKTLMDIEQMYGYDFNVEYSVANRPSIT